MNYKFGFTAEVPVMTNHLPEVRRKEIFLALVAAQDKDMNVVQSRWLITKQFNINVRQLCQIEDEGLDNEWPPL